MRCVGVRSRVKWWLPPNATAGGVSSVAIATRCVSHRGVSRSSLPTISTRTRRALSTLTSRPGTPAMDQSALVVGDGLRNRHPGEAARERQLPRQNRSVATDAGLTCITACLRSHLSAGCSHHGSGPRGALPIGSLVRPAPFQIASGSKGARTRAEAVTTH